MQYNDHPLMECFKTAKEKVWSKGGQTFQKFTCENCGNRLTMDEPNVFYTKGHCDSCNFVTDLEKNGCNYLVLFETGGDLTHGN